MNTVIVSYESWSRFWINMILQIGHPYRSDLITKKLEEEYSIVKWYAVTETTTTTIMYTDEKLITFWLLKWG